MSIAPADIIALFRARGRGDPPSALADVFVGPLVMTTNFLDAKIDLARAEQTLDRAIFTLEDDETLDGLAAVLGEDRQTIIDRLKGAIEDVASNFGLIRRAATGSRGSVLLLRSAQIDNPITVAAGRRVAAPLLEREYRVTTSVIISAMTLDETLAKFVFSVPVESVGVGLNTVAGPDQVTQVKEPISGIEGVTNRDAIVGGRDEETDRGFVARIKDVLSANNIGTKAGYRRMVLTGLDAVKDVLIVGAGDPFMIRDGDGGGSVDIYVTDPDPVTVTELATADNFVPSGPSFVFTPSRQPVVDDLAAVQPTDATVITKDAGVFGGSVRAQDTITFATDHTAAFITYQANDLVRQVDDFVQEPERKILASDVLVKEALFVLIDVFLTIRVLPEFNNIRTTVQARVEAAITELISILGIGVSLEQSDLLKAVTEVDGVDRVNLPLTKFERSVNTGTLNVIDAAANEVLRVGTIQVTVVS